MRLCLITLFTVFFSLCASLSAADDLDEITRIGIEYLQGDERPQNIELGKEMLLRAAEGGHAHARYALGYIAYQEEDYETARTWYGLAAKEGHISASGALGAMLYYGEGGPSDPHEAIEWLLIAAEEEISYAQYLLYEMYSGAERRIPYDLEKSLYWAERAASNGDADAMVIVGKAYERDPRGSTKMDQAIQLFKKAAEQDHCEAYLSLGSTFLSDLYGAPQDKDQAAFYLNAAIHSENCGSYEKGSARELLRQLDNA